MSFEANQGQADPRVKFLSRGRGYTLFLTNDEAVLGLRSQKPEVRSQNQERPLSVVSDQLGRKSKLEIRNSSPFSSFDFRVSAFDKGPRTTDVLRMILVGANRTARVTALDELPGKSNYFIGKDPGKWRTGVPTYAKVKYEHVYPGVDLIYYGNQQQLEYDFVVAPGADPSAIALEVETGNAKLESRITGPESRIPNLCGSTPTAT